MTHPETIASFFFSWNWDSHNQNSQFKKFEKKSVVSFCPRWTSLSWKPVVQYHQRTGTVSFVCGAALEGHWTKSERVMDSGQNPVEPLL